MKLHEVLENTLIDKRKIFEININHFNKEFFPNGQVNFYSDFVKVKSPNVLEWNNQLHQELCELFGLKLIKITKLEVWRARKASYSFHLEYIYVDEQDTNFQELDIGSVRIV